MFFRPALLVAACLASTTTLAQNWPDSSLTSECGIFREDWRAAPVEDCLSCHDRADHGHPVQLDYERARWGGGFGGSELRPLEEVQRRGVHVPDGEVRCVTCHSPESPYKYRIALPAGSRIDPAVDPRLPYPHTVELNPDRPDVGRKPLCLACHAMD